MAGVEVIAITGERPEHFAQSGSNLGQLKFPVLYDEGYQVMREYSVVYEVPPAVNEVYLEAGLDLAAVAGTDEPLLPVPGAVIVKPDGEVFDARFDLDYTSRPEVDELLMIATFASSQDGRAVIVPQ